MSNLTNYEISIWEDVFNVNGELEEQKLMVIGASDMLTQSRALSPHFKRGVNGTNELNFDMYYRYVDNVTGDEVENQFVKYITNETKIKLKKDGKWFDFIIKDIQEDSVNKIFKYQATDLHVNELSKNGFGLTLDTELGNNIGTVGELGSRIFEGTGWAVDAETIPQKVQENLIAIKLNTNLNLTNLVRLNDTNVAPTETTNITLALKPNDIIYVFYSVLKEGRDRFQFIYVNGTINKNSDRIIQNKNCQYYIDGVTYSLPTGGNLQTYGLQLPNFLDGIGFDATVSYDYCGERYVFSQKTSFNSVLNKYVNEYIDGTTTWHEYSETEYEAPVLIKNLITNTDFKSTTGWTGQYLTTLGPDGKPVNGNKVKDLGATRDVATNPDMLESLISGNYDENQEYTPYLKASFKSANSILINSGPYDNRKSIENFSPNQRFVLAWRCLTSTQSQEFLDDFDIKLVEYSYSVDGNCYLSNDASVIATANGERYDYVDNGNTIYYTYLTIDENYALTENQFLAKKFQIIFQPKEGYVWKDGFQIRLDLVDLQLYPYVAAELSDEQTTPFIRPDSQPTQTKINTKYHYFNPNIDVNKNATSQNEMVIIDTDSKWTHIKPSYEPGANKSVTLSVKQSNYFNAAQSLAETAQCWAEFDVVHDEDGYIQSKTVKFKNYIGQDNYAGFRYGVNLKSIQRTNTSRSIVTKLIVQDITNEFANNGFCTIARAGSNETGETFIYDFSHYVRQKQLDYDGLQSDLYGVDEACGPDVEGWDASTMTRNLKGYCFRIGALNKQIDELSTILSSHSVALLQAKAELQIATAGATKAAEQHETAAIDFLKIVGYEYKNATEEQAAAIRNNDELAKAFEKVATYEAAYKNFEIQKASALATVADYEELAADYTEDIEELKEQKTWLNDAFATKYRRFIQEGTWSKQESVDDEKYYLDAKSVAYTSAQPQVTYSISVISLDGVEGYENFSFELADKTYMEDEEFFGYDEEGNPYREEVVLTEINYYLDEPDKTTIKVQNFKNQFQDLFQRITASVQTVNYASPAWNSAGSFVNSDKQSQASFLVDALNNAEITLQNAGEQSVETGAEGITVTDLSSPDQKIRIVGGAILLGSNDENGQERWDIGMTAAGINAKTITAGRLNTGEVIIMNGDHPTFRWDSKGITAYSFATKVSEETGTEVDYDYNYNKGVRFDRFGLYGYDGQGQTWAPKNLNEVRERANFALTWDGLQVEASNKTYGGIVHRGGLVTKLGRIDDNIYNGWSDTNLPIYDSNKKNEPTFVKVFTVGNTTGNEQLVIYDDGTLTANNIKLTGSIEWTEASSPSKTVYATAAYVGSNVEDKNHPVDKTKYKDIPKIEDDNYTGWHQISGTNDSYYATTDNGGATWQGPFLITGKSIVNTIVEYKIDTAGKDPALVTGWSTSYPTSSPGTGQSLYIRMHDVFNNGDPSTYRYSVGGGQGATGPAGPGAINCYVESLSGNLFNENTTGDITLTARIFQGDKEIDPITANNIQQLNYTWYINGTEDTSLTTKQITIAFGNIKNKSIYFEAE